MMAKRRAPREGPDRWGWTVILWLCAVLAALAPLPVAETAPGEGAGAVVRAREEAFARSMADRDHAAFVSFLAEEAIFCGTTVLRGRTAVAEGWRRVFAGPTAPFSWAPERVEVVASGTLALTSGPVFDPAGRRIGTFTSTWRKEADGVWRIVLDSFCPPCDCAGASHTPSLE